MSKYSLNKGYDDNNDDDNNYKTKEIQTEVVSNHFDLKFILTYNSYTLRKRWS